MFRKIAVFLFVAIGLCNLTAQQLVLNTGHSEAVNCVAFSPNGQYIASGSDDHTIKLWNVQSGREMRAFEGHASQISFLEFHPHGKTLMSGSANGKLTIWNIENGKELFSFVGQNEWTENVKFSPNGEFIAVANNNFIVLHNAQTGKEIGKIETSVQNIACISFSSDGKNLAVAGSDNLIRLWDMQTKREVGQLKGHGKQIKSIQYSPNGQHIISYSSDNTVKLWSVASGQQIHNFAEQAEKVQGVNFINNNQFLSYDIKGFVKIIDITTGKETQQIATHAPWTKGVAVHSNRKILAKGFGNGTITLWSIETGEKISTLKSNTFGVQKSNFSPEGNFIVSQSTFQNKKTFWNINTGQVINVSDSQSENSFTTSPDETQIISGSYVAINKTTGIITFIDGQTGRSTHNLSINSNGIVDLTSSNDGKFLVIANYNNTITIVNSKNGVEIKTLPQINGKIETIQISPNDKYILAISHRMLSRALRKEILTLFNLETGVLVFDIEANTRNRIAPAFSPDSRQLAIANDSILTTWDTHSGQEIHKFIGHSDRITQVIFSPDGKILASASRDKTAKLWNPNTGKIINTFAGHDKAVNAIAFNPNGQIVATTGEDRIIKVWEANTLHPLHNIFGHTNDIHSLSMSPNGKFLASASADGTTRMWSLQTAQPLAILYALENKDWLVVTPDGKFDGNQEAMKQLHYIKNLDIIPLESLFENYYTPRLLSKIANNELWESNTANVFVLKPMPTVQIVSPENNSTIAQGQVKITVKATDQGGGIDEVRLYHNGKLLDGTTRGFKSTGQNHEFTVMLTNGENRIKATAFNSQRTESIPNEIVVHYKAPEIVKPSMHILAIGINSYLNPKYNLNYAKNDADVFVKSLSEGASSLFGKVEVTTINDASATKTGILGAIEKIKATAKAEDVFVFYYAGHGVMSSGNSVEKPDFYLVPHNVTKMYEADDELKSKGISAREIGEFSKSIRSQKQLFVLDACQSGGAVQSFAMRGAAEEKAIAQLSRSTGTYFIAASGTEQFATEVATLGHGIFTYSIIEALKGACKSHDGRLTVNLLKGCVEDMVPELSKKHKGVPQFPTGYGFGQDFPLVIVR